MDVLMPQLGETVTEGTLSAWHKAVGEAVQPGDVLFEIETDKTSMEIPATFAGTLAEIRVAKGQVVAVGTVVAVLSESAPGPAQPMSVPDMSLTAQPAAARTEAPDRYRTVRTPAENFGRSRLRNGTLVTPFARRLAAQAQIELDDVNGSGPHGRILGRDIQASRAGARTAPTPNAPDVPDAVNSVTRLYAHTAFEPIPLDAMRKRIAKRLLQAKQSIPHFYLSMAVTLDALIARRAAANEAAAFGAQGTPGLKLSLNDFFIKALGRALMRVPAANCVWAGDRLLRFRQADIGVAVAIDGGVLTPVVRHVESKTLIEISTEMRSLAARARERTLLPDEYQGGSIAISNLGMLGIEEFLAIINPPHAAILAIGAATRVALESADGGVRFASQMRVSLSCDHRVIDGALGAELLAAFKHGIENPAELLLR
jgi:pyruvate dehydrogenase E2 component (dihydrolipoamide acetyltransferase)